MLSADGEILMPLDSYDFSEYFGWCADKFGVSWQLMLTNPDGESRPFIMPAMLFTREARGKAETAREKYIRVLSALGESCEGNRVDYPGSPVSFFFQTLSLQAFGLSSTIRPLITLLPLTRGFRSWFSVKVKNS